MQSTLRIYFFSVDILEVFLLTRSARTAGTTSATTNAVRCDFSAQRLGPWVLEVVVVAGCNLLGLAKQRLLQVAGKIERLLLQLEVGAKRLSWGSVNSACSTKIFIYDYHLWYRLYICGKVLPWVDVSNSGMCYSFFLQTQHGQKGLNLTNLYVCTAPFV